jgi:uncharacterized protein (DUF488 family)
VEISVVLLSDPNCTGLKRLFTVGHSNLDFEQFVKLLRDSAVELVVDVRTKPQSSRFPQFSQPGFQRLLAAEGIAYLFLGEELGGRPDDPDAYRPDGLVDYRSRRKSYAFRAGLERLLNELEAHTLAMMCAEEDPLECHRFLMICPELVRAGIQPLHIRKGSRIEMQSAAESRLLEWTGSGAITVDAVLPEVPIERPKKTTAPKPNSWGTALCRHDVAGDHARTRRRSDRLTGIVSLRLGC